MKAKDCFCFTCNKEFHHLGIMSHRVMHRNKKQECKIQYSSGIIMLHGFNFTKKEEV